MVPAPPDSEWPVLQMRSELAATLWELFREWIARCGPTMVKPGISFELIFFLKVGMTWTIFRVGSRIVVLRRVLLAWKG